MNVDPATKTDGLSSSSQMKNNERLAQFDVEQNTNDTFNQENETALNATESNN